MNDIIAMAREAGANYYGTGEEGVTAFMLRDEAIERFAALVRAAEREACAKVCEECGAIVDGLTPKDCAAAIRARGQA
jgi:hypothetical protein